MRIKDFKTRKVQLVLDDDTFEVLESNNPELAEIWNTWLNEGFDKIGIPVDAEEDTAKTIILSDELIKVFPQESIGFFQDVLNKRGFFLDK